MAWHIYIFRFICPLSKGLEILGHSKEYSWTQLHEWTPGDFLISDKYYKYKSDRFLWLYLSLAGNRVEAFARRGTIWKGHDFKESCWDSKGWWEGLFHDFCGVLQQPGSPLTSLMLLTYCQAVVTKWVPFRDVGFRSWYEEREMKACSFCCSPLLVYCCYRKNTRAWKSWAWRYRHVHLALGRQRWKDHVSKSSGVNWSLTTQIKWT